ncbi:MAG TPA: acetyl-CoA carboxylase biotin carboxyl carrier protein [Bacillota bacterium]|nr:acetyl-CoA carboxylase biotin carboxyl carrier protein [Bacillota bacterium]
MLKIHDIREMIRLVDQSSVAELEVEENGNRISIKKNVVTTVATTAVPVQQAVVTPPVVPAVQEVKAAVQEVKAAAKEAAPAVQEITAAEQDLKKILSPMVGTFYSKPEPTAETFVKVGDKVTPESIVCIVEAMKLFNEIEAEVTGEIVKVLVNEGQLVEYGQPLFLVKTEE